MEILVSLIGIGVELLGTWARSSDEDRAAIEADAQKHLDELTATRNALLLKFDAADKETKEIIEHP